MTSKRSIERRIEELEESEGSDQEGLDIIVRRARVDENGEFVEVVSETRCGLDENGEWFVE